MKITLDQVEHLARLARLQFSEEEKKSFLKDLDQILNYVEKINELNTENVEPTSHVLELKNVFRLDDVFQFSDYKEILKNAPSLHDGYYCVPPII